jgi:carboxyl-terminal processing protease
MGISFRSRLLGLLLCIPFLSCFASEQLRPSAQMHTETLYMVRCLAGIHYDHRPISALSRDEILDAYLDDLDPQHLFFLRQDVEDIHARYNLTLDIFLNSGSVKPAFAIYDLFRERANGRLDAIDELLQGDPNFSDAEFYEPERKEAPWPLDMDEADDFWRRRLEFEMLNEILQIPDSVCSEEVREKSKAEDEPKPPAKGEERRGKRTRTGRLGRKISVEEDSVGPVEIVEEVQNCENESIRRARESLRRRYVRLRSAVNDVEPAMVQEFFLNAVAGLYDPHSSFLSAATYEDFQASLTNSMTGIGAVLQDDDGYCKIVEIYAGSPAERSGQLRPGDRILAVQQGEDEEAVDIIGMRLNRAVKLIRGPKGTEVTLHIQPAGGDPAERKIVPLVRDEIQLTSQRARGRVYSLTDAADQPFALGYIRLPAFYGGGDSVGSCADVEELLRKLCEADIRGLVIDLRGNSGGLLDEAIAIAGLFLEGGPVVQVRDGEGRVQVFSNPGRGILYRGPLLILTSRQSVSASEILAGALQDHRRALVVGDHSTYGKGSVQAILPMNQSFLFLKNGPQLGAARITIQKWYRPRGESIQRRGVLADIVFPSTNDALPIGEENNPHALPWDTVPEAAWEGWTVDGGCLAPVSVELAENLRLRSEERRQMAEWKLVEERVAGFEERMQQKQFSLNLAERQGKRAEDKVLWQELSRRSRELARENYPFTEVRLAAAEVGTDETRDDGGAENLGNLEDDGPGEDGSGEILLPLDVPLRESLRILLDWISLIPGGGRGDTAHCAN